MKVFVQIPCFNEEQTLPMVLKSIPKQIDGVDALEILVIDDGSIDQTVEVAKSYGVRHFVIHSKNMGLARSFHDGIDYALAHGADIIVNTDGDNQYPQERIGDLIKPIIDGKAEIVIADRQTGKIAHFSPLKKLLQQMGSKVVSKASGITLPDAASGFRAYSKKALLHINIITKFSYCIETIIHAGNKRIPIESIQVEINPKTRESRLFKNIWQHIYKSGRAIIRSYIMYRPYLIFNAMGIILLIGGIIPYARYAVLLLKGTQGDHIQSLLLGAVLLFAGMISFALAVFSDLMRTNRTLLEDLLERTKKIQYKCEQTK